MTTCFSLVGANGPVRGPHPVRASEEEKEIQGGMVGKKKEAPRCSLLASMQTSDPRRLVLKALPNLSLNVSDTLRATRAK